MKAHIKISMFFCISFFTTSICQGFTTHLIQFGGTFGFAYSPASINVVVGDTIKWVGKFSLFPLQSTSVPAGATVIGPITSGDTFKYTVTVAGEYDYQNNTY